MRNTLLTVLLATSLVPLACSSDAGDTESPVGNNGGGVFDGGGGADPAGGTASGAGAEGSGGAPVGTGGDGSGGTPSAGGGSPSGGTAAGGAATGGAPDGGGSGTSYGTEAMIEESATGQCAVDGVVESTNGGFSGTGYLNSDNVSGASIEWAVDVGEAGTYTLAFTFANGGGAGRPGAVVVDGATPGTSVDFPATGAWTTWSTASVDVTLAAGERRIVLTAMDAAGLANVDAVRVTGAAVNAASCDGGGAGGGGAGGATDGGSNAGGASNGGSSSGGASNGGSGAGGATNGGSSNGGSSNGGTPSGSALADAWPCDGPDSAYDYVVDGSGNSHTVNGGGTYTYQAAIETALGSGNRTILVRSSGDVSGAAQLRIRDNTVFNVCGTINVTNDASGSDRTPAFGRDATNIDIPHFNLTGNAQYGMFFRSVSNLHLGEIRIDGTGGIGIRIDNNPSNNCWGRCNQVTNIQLDDVAVSNTGGHGVETYGVDGLTIGTVTARNTTNAGLLLNATINATVGTVDGEDVATGNGYATFRVANEAGKIGDGWPAGNIRVGLVRARRGGRGIFCVSDSGGTTIERVDIANTGGDSMLLENCHTFTVATEGGTVTGGGGIFITQRTNEHTPSSNVTVQNLDASGNVVGESRCGTNNLICNMSGSSGVSGCTGTVQASCP